MTKAELEKEVKRLKSTIRELQKANKLTEEVSSDLSDIAYGITVVNDDGRKRLALVKISFDLEKNCAIIDKSSLFVDTLINVNTKMRQETHNNIIRRNKEIG